MKSAIAAYKNNKLSGIHEASPAKLVAMLLDEAIACCNAAASSCENGNIGKKGESVSKAMSIIDAGLLSALDYDKGGELALNLASLYQYCLKTLFEANLANHAQGMRECAEHLGKIREGWRAAEELDRR